MTISSTTRKAGPYVGNGVATSFVFSFKVFAASEIVVTRTSVTAGTETVLVLTTDYTVTLNADQNTNPGGTVTYNPSGVPMSSTYNLTITSDVLQTQETDIPNAGGWYPEVAEDAWDKNTILTQQIKEVLDRTLQFPVADGNPPQLPPFASRKNRVLGFDGSGALTTYPTTAGVAAGAFADTVIATAGQTVISVRPYVMGVNTLAVFLNGVRQEYGVDYTETTATSYTFVSGLTAGDKVISVIGQESAGIGATDAALVSYLPAGTGAVVTNVQTKLREYINVKDFGAVGDGIADDTAAIQAAFNAAHGTYDTRNKRTVFFPQGDYGISDTIDVNLATTDYYSPGIEGEGPQSVRIKALAGMTATKSMLRLNGGSPGIFFQKITGFQVEHLSDANGQGIELNNIGGILIDNVGFDNVKSAVRMHAHGGGFCELNEIVNCRFGYNVTYWLEYYGVGSFRSSGLGPGCNGNVVNSQRCVKLTASGGDPHVYNAPFFVNVWGDATTVLWTHGGTTPARLFGHITYEANAQITFGDSGVQTFIGNFDGISVSPAFGTFNVGGSHGATGIHYTPGGVKLNATATVLTDYIEGVWTPSLNGSALAAGIGKYTKIGRQVTLTLGNQAMPALSIGDALVITGIPFLPSGSSYDFSSAILLSVGDASDGYKKYPMVGTLANNGDMSCTIQGINVTTSDPFSLSLTYFTNS